MTLAPDLRRRALALADDWWVRLSLALVVIGGFAYLPIWPEAFRRWFHEHAFSIVVLAPVIGATLGGLSRVASRREQQFWGLIGSAFALILAAGLLLGEGPVPAVVGDFSLRQAAYWLAYTLMLLASEWRAHVPDDLRRPDRRVRQLRLLGLMVVSLVNFVYFVAVPAWSVPQPLDLVIVSGWMFLVMADATTARFTYAWRRAAPGRWRGIYGGLAVGFALLTFTDAQGLGAHGYGRTWEWIGDPADIAWLAFGVVFTLTARFRHVPDEDHSLNASLLSPFHDTLNTGRFLLGATVLVPAGHLALSAGAFMPTLPHQVTADVAVLVTTLLLAGLTWLSLKVLLDEALVRVNGTIGHDLRGLAFVLGTFTEFVRARTGDRPDVAAGVQHLHETTLALSALATQLLRPDATAARAPMLSLQDAVMSLEPRLRAALPPHVTLQLRCEADDDRVAAPAADVERVVMNLVQNSLHAMPGGGS
jgi:signal transduction histidine kinase